MFGDTVVACLLATTMAFGLSAGMSEIAVSTLSVLAGRNQPCGSLDASTWAGPASAMAPPGAFILGRRGDRTRRVVDQHPAAGKLRAPDRRGGRGRGRGRS